jgi:hypothetical protein
MRSRVAGEALGVRDVIGGQAVESGDAVELRDRTGLQLAQLGLARQGEVVRCTEKLRFRH